MFPEQCLPCRIPTTKELLQSNECSGKKTKAWGCSRFIRFVWSPNPSPFAKEDVHVHSCRLPKGSLLKAAFPDFHDFRSSYNNLRKSNSLSHLSAQEQQKEAMHELGAKMGPEVVQQVVTVCKGRDREKCGLVTGTGCGECGLGF